MLFLLQFYLTTNYILFFTTHTITQLSIILLDNYFLQYNIMNSVGLRLFIFHLIRQKGYLTIRCANQANFNNIFFYRFKCVVVMNILVFYVELIDILKNKLPFLVLIFCIYLHYKLLRRGTVTCFSVYRFSQHK